jgi:hypothetical protein
MGMSVLKATTKLAWFTDGAVSRRRRPVCGSWPACQRKIFLPFQCEDSFIEAWMGLSELLVTVKKSIISKRFHNFLLGFQVGGLCIVDYGLPIETAMDAGGLPAGKVANRARRFDQKVDECLLIFWFDVEDVDLGDETRVGLDDGHGDSPFD